MSPFLLAVPFFAFLITLETFFSFAKQRPWFRFDDSIRNITCGILEEILAVFARLATAWVYILIFQRAALFAIPFTWWGWALAYLGVDFCYYWFHRVSHRSGLFWAMHSVHHQSELYNLTVALRQSALGGFLAWIFYLPLAWLGVPPEMAAGCYALNLLYQFWIHTEAIDRLGWFERPMNTPSHHRVHHGRNSKYLDKNYAGTLIVWDKWFGTFIPETERPEYGVVKRLVSQNPVWANLEGWQTLWKKSSRAKTAGQKLYAWIAPPEWEPERLPPYIATDAEPAALPFRKKRNVAVLFTINFAFVLSFFTWGQGLTLSQAILCAIWFVFSWGGLVVYLDRK